MGSRCELLLLVLCVSVLPGLAQDRAHGALTDVQDTLDLPLKLLSIEDGLSQGMVNAIAQDRHGFLWFATKDGLDRYDGYQFKVFRHDDRDRNSLRENFTTAIAEGPDGRIYVGTASLGLDLFDPERETFHQVDLGEVGNTSNVYSILHDRSQDIWVATTKGLFVVTGADSASTARMVFNDQCRAAMDKEGHIWCYVRENGAYRITPDANGGYDIDTLDMDLVADGPWTPDPNTSQNGHFVVDPRSGAIYGVFPYFIARYDPNTLLPVILHRVPYPHGSRMESDQLAIDANGHLWIASVELRRFDPAQRTMVRVLPRDPALVTAVNDVSVTHIDRTGMVWIGSKGYGILRYDPAMEVFGTHPDESVYCMKEIGGDRLIVQTRWDFLRVFDAGTGGFTLQLKDDDPVLRAQFSGLVPDTFSPLKSGDSLYWMAKGGVISFDPVTLKVRHYPILDSTGRELPRRKGFFPLVEDHRGLLWFGADTALYSFDRETGLFKEFRYPIVPVHTPYRFAQSIVVDHEGTVWVGSTRGLLRLDPTTGNWTVYQNDPENTASLSFDLIFCLLNDPESPDRYLWIGTNGGGVNRFDKRNGSCSRYGSKQGLPNEVVYGILDDTEGNLWMSTNKGICRLDPRTGGVRNFDATDGLQGDEFNRNAYCKLPDGRLCFGGVKGFNIFDPGQVIAPPAPPQLCLTDIKLLNRSIPFQKEGAPLSAPAFLSTGMTIPYETNMITFEFANMDFADTENNAFRYQLIGFDPEPITSGTKNSAIYTNLDPGTYHFQLSTRLRNEDWSEPQPMFQLVITPPWYRTRVAYVSYVLLAMLTSFTYTRLRTRSLIRRKKQLEHTVALRTREIAEERDRSEELLLNILPEEVAEELKANGEAEAKLIDQVTVLFTDFKGFTAMSEQLSPKELVKDLHECFSTFDNICEKYGLEKIKTIGDAYMAAGGLPTPNTTHATDVIKAALEMRDFIAEGKARKVAVGLPYFEVRIGIHTGPVVAGIVGVKKFQYDIWGDTVNTASRMESSGEVGQVNISGATYEMVKEAMKEKDVKEVVDGHNTQHATRQPATGPALTFTPRGKVQAKGKGEMEMYFVELSA